MSSSNSSSHFPVTRAMLGSRTSSAPSLNTSNSSHAKSEPETETEVDSPSKSRRHRRSSFDSGNRSPMRSNGHNGQWMVQVPWPPAGSALLVAAMLVSFVFLHTEVEWIEVEDPEGMVETDEAVSVTEGAAALLGASVGDKRLLQEPEEDDPAGAAARHRQRLAAQQGKFWEKPAEDDDKPSWQRALEEQAKRRAEDQARRAASEAEARRQGYSADSGSDPLLGADDLPGSGSSSGAQGADSKAAADDPQAAAKAAAKAASTGGRIENKEEWEKAMVKLSDSIITDVTIVVTPKHWLGCSIYQLQQLLENVPSGMKILYFLSPSLEPKDKETLQAFAKKLPNLELKSADSFSSGFHMRNASIEFVKTKYALFIFNDIVPSSKFWLHELFSFAEQRPEGVIFLPYIWQKGRATSVAPTAARKLKALRKATSSSASKSLTSSAAALAPGVAEAQASLVSSFVFPEDTVQQEHGPFIVDVVFDDFSNDGKLYVQRLEDNQVTGSRDPAQLEPRESAAAVEDHCLLVRQSLLEEALVFDPKAGWSREELDMALTVRYYNYRSFLVPQSQVIYLHPSLGMPALPPSPTQVAFFATQTNDDACSSNQVHLRQKWGIVTGQLCRGFVDSAMRHVKWGSAELAALSQGEQLQLVLSFFSLLGMNRFQLQGLDSWQDPPAAPPIRCKPTAREKEKDNFCQPVPEWMTSAASDFPTMVKGALNLDDALKTGTSDKPKGAGLSDGPEVWMGRAELLLPLRVNRVEDLWRAASLREGQLFTVRRGTVKSGEKHPGRRAPELPHLMRMYLPFAVLEFEFELTVKEVGDMDGGNSFGLGGGTTGGKKSSTDAARAAAALGKMCFLQGMSVVVQEHCITQNSADSEGETGYLLHKKGRPCIKSNMYFRGFLFVRHTDMDHTPLKMFQKLRKSLQRNMVLPEKEKGGRGAWMEGRKMATWLTPCFANVVKRMRMTRCVPGAGDQCTVHLPVGSSPGGWSLVLWTWRPQSVRTTQVLLLQPGAHRVVI